MKESQEPIITLKHIEELTLQLQKANDSYDCEAIIMIQEQIHELLEIINDHIRTK